MLAREIVNILEHTGQGTLEERRKTIARYWGHPDYFLKWKRVPTSTGSWQWVERLVDRRRSAAAPTMTPWILALRYANHLMVGFLQPHEVVPHRNSTLHRVACVFHVEFNTCEALYNYARNVPKAALLDLKNFHKTLEDHTLRALAVLARLRQGAALPE